MNKYEALLFEENYRLRHVLEACQVTNGQMLDALNSVVDENATLTIPTANKVIDAIKTASEPVK